MSNTHGKPRVGRDLLSRCGGARAAEPDDRDAARPSRSSCSTASAQPASRRRSTAQRREFRAREIILCAGAHPDARDADARRDRSGRAICARSASRCARTCPASDAICRTIRCCSSARICARTRGSRHSLRTLQVSCFRLSSGLPDCPPTDLFIHLQSKSSWNALGEQIANFGPVLWKPFSRGRVSLAADAHDRTRWSSSTSSPTSATCARLKHGFRWTAELLVRPSRCAR